MLKNALNHSDFKVFKSANDQKILDGKSLLINEITGT